jgi:hypothetical protein
MDVYLHGRVLFSIILGLGIFRLLTGVAKMVQHPKEYKVYCVHLLWGARPLLFSPVLVVGVSFARYSAMDFPSLSVPLSLCRSSLSSVRSVFPRTNGGLRQLQSVVLFPPPLDLQLYDCSFCRGLCGHLDQRHGAVFATSYEILLLLKYYVTMG